MRIDNSNVIREVDPRASRDLWWLLVLVMTLVGGLVLYAWPHLQIRETSDSGRTLVVSEPNGPQAAVYRDIAKNVWTELGKTRGSDRAAPRIVIEA